MLDYDQSTGKASTHSADAILKAAAEEGLTVEWVLETHAHADHLSGAPYVKLKTGAKVGIGEHIREVQKIFRPVFNATDVSGDGSEFDHLFAEGETFRIGELEGSILHTPGHTPACVSYVIGDAVFVGDTLFMPDYGTARADFPGGDARTLYRSIQKLLALPDETRIFVCHDYLPGGPQGLCLGDDDRRGAQERATRRRQRGRVRRMARGARLQAGGAAAAAALDPDQHPRRQAAAAGRQRRLLHQDSGQAGELSGRRATIGGTAEAVIPYGQSVAQVAAQDDLPGGG